MRVLVTGGAGFIGSNWVLNRVVNTKDSFIVVDKLSYAGTLDNLEPLKPGTDFDFVKCDISSNPTLLNIMMREADLCINFAAESHVDRSIENPTPFTTNNILLMQNVLEACRTQGVPLIQISCYDENTRAVTTEGLKTFRELEVGDIVLSINPTTKIIEEKRILKVIIQDYSGEMIHFKSRTSDLLVTPNHRMYYDNEKDLSAPLRISEAKDYSLYHGVYPQGVWDSQIYRDTEVMDIPFIGEVHIKDFMYVIGAYLGDGFTAYQERQVTKKETGKTYVNRSWRIFFDVPENDKCRKPLEQALTNLGINWHPEKGASGKHIYFTSKDWSEVFNECGKGFYNKRIPSWMLQMPPRFLAPLLQGLLDSDGNGRNIYSTSSPTLRDSVVELAIKLGHSPRVGERPITETYSKKLDRTIKGNHINYMIYLRSQRRRKIISPTFPKTSVPYKGKIWCLTVEDNKNFLVERNGYYSFSGNTDEILRHYPPTASILRIAEKLDINDVRCGPLYDPRSPYAASKAACEMLCNGYKETYGLPIDIIRCVNNYGPRQYPEKLLPLAIKNIREYKHVPLYGRGMQWRDWLYVEDFCSAIDRVIECRTGKDIWHVSAYNEIQNIKLIKQLINVMGKGSFKYVEDRLGHDFSYSLDSSKLRRRGWQPKTSLEEGLKKTVEWYVRNQTSISK